MVQKQRLGPEIVTCSQMQLLGPLYLKVFNSTVTKANCKPKKTHLLCHLSICLALF